MSAAKSQQSSSKPAAKKREEEEEDRIPITVQFFTYMSYALLMLFGYIREAFRRFFPLSDRKPPEGYAAAVRDFDDFWTRRLYRRIRDCWNRAIDSRPGRTVSVMETVSSDQNKTISFTGRSIPCINLGSYNYLGFAEDLPSITENNLLALDRYGVGACASQQEGGRSISLVELERETAKFVGKEAAVVFAMGFATNFSGLPALFDKETLVISDSLNHASLVAGVRISAGRVKVFPHNNIPTLERVIRSAIISGQPRTHKKWKRIVIVVEGIYSMEGDICNLKAIVELKKKYRCLVYMDEAHSIGAIGKTARGACEYNGVDPKDVDLLMGTFTKSFGSIGGYIAGDKKLIDYIRRKSGATVIGDALFSAACVQALSSLRVLQGQDGTTVGKEKIARLAENARFFREGLTKMGLTVFGNDDSPVIPAMVYNPGKMPAFSRECLKRNLAVVVVGYPATSLITSRVRFCVSASHTKADLERALVALDEVAAITSIRYERKWYFL